MASRVIKYLLFLSAFVFISNAQQVNFIRYSISDGLCDQQITDINFDENGKILLGTPYGFSVGNGLEFICNYPDSISSEKRVNCITECKGKIYVGTDIGLYIFNTAYQQIEHFKTFGKIEEIVCSKDEIFIVSQKQIYYGKNTHFQKIEHPEIKNDYEFSSAIFAKNKLFVGTSNGKLISLYTDKKTKQLSVNTLTVANENSILTDICIGLENRITICSSNGIYEFDGIDFNKIKFPGSEKHYFTCIAYNTFSRKLWAGSWGGGVFEFDKISYKTFSNTGNLTDEVITDIHCDQYGNTWIGTFNQGLFRLRLGNIEIFNAKDGLKNNHVSSLLPFGDKVFLTTFGGIYIYDGLEVYPIKNTEEKRFSSICEHSGQIYAVSHNGTVYRINPYTDYSEQLFQDKALIEAMHISSFQGKLYVWCYNSGLYEIKENTVQKVISINEAGNRNIYCSLAHDGKLYFGTNLGVVMFNGVTFTDTLNSNPNIGKSRINQIVFNNNSLLIATNEAGLWKYDLQRKRFFYATSSKDPKNRSIQAVTQISDSSLFLLSTRNGSMLVDFENNEKISKVFDDLMALKISPGASLQFGNDFLIGSSSGLIKFNKIAIKRPKAPIKIFASDFYYQSNENRKKIPHLKKLQHERGSFGFKISAISFDEGNLSFRYRIKDKSKWSPLSKNNEININNLPPGNYTILVEAVSDNKNKSKVLEIPVVVLEPFWMSFWFFLVVLLSFIVIVVGVLRFIIPKTEIKLINTLEFRPLIYKIVLIIGGLIYPIVSYLDRINSPNMVDPQSGVSISIGVILILIGISAFFTKKLDRFLKTITYTAYFLILAHLLLLTYTNELISAHVIGILIAITFSTLILEKISHYLIFSILLFSTYFLIVFSIKNPEFDPSRTLSALITMLIVIGLIISARRSFFNKLSIGNSVLNLGNDLALVVNNKRKLIYATSNIPSKTGLSENELFDNVISALSLQGKTINSIALDEPDTYFDFHFNHKGKNLYYRLRIKGTENAYSLLNLYDISKTIELEKEKEMLSLVAEKSSSGIVISNPEGKVEWCNQSMEKITGYSLNELLGKRPSQVLQIHKESRLEIPKDYLNNGFAIAAPHLHKSGKEIWLEIINTPVLDKNGKLFQQIEIINDITDKKIAENELKNSSQRLKTLNEISQAIMEKNDIEGALFKPLEEYFSKYSLVRITIATFNMQEETVTFYFTDDKINRFLTNTTISVKEISSYNTLKNKDIYFVSDINEIENPSATDLSMLEDGIRSYFMYPLFSKNELLGSLNMSFANPDDINEQMMQEIEFFASGISVALNQVHLINQLNKERKEIKEINKDLTDSISYAKKLQDAKLPDLKLLKNNFTEAAIYYKPKEIVSGDFYYWTRKGDSIIFTVADCTGHGVPGAFMTILSSNLLDNIINEKGISDPGMILSYLNAGIIEYFNKTLSKNWEEQIRDGLDLAIASFNLLTGQLKIAQAKRPVIIQKNGKIEIIKPKGFSIGDIHNPNPLYDSLTLELKSGEAIFMFSDGPTDQFGGERNKKYTVRRLINIIDEHQNKSIPEILNIFEKDMANYMKGYSQTDDMVLLGVRL